MSLTGLDNFKPKPHATIYGQVVYTPMRDSDSPGVLPGPGSDATSDYEPSLVNKLNRPLLPSEINKG